MKSENPIVMLGVYRHFKGGIYTVVGFAKHTETEEILVIYRSNKSGETWARPLSMWNDIKDGKRRFEYLGSIPEFQYYGDVSGTD